MAFADPQSVTISGVTTSLPRISTDDNGSRYSSADSSLILIAQSIYGKRIRRVTRFNHSKYAVDPLFPAQNSPYSMSAIMTIDVPRVGYTLAEQKAVVDGWLGNLQAASGLNITKLLGGEN